MNEIIKEKIVSFNVESKNHNTGLLNKYSSDIYTYQKRIRLLIENLPAYQQNVPFNKENKTLKQFVNSCSDFVLQNYVQFKIILTEIEPVIRDYHKDRWALLPDNSIIPADVALNLIENIHKKLFIILNNLKTGDLQRQYFNPAVNKTLTLKNFLDHYIDGCNTHIIKIIQVKKMIKEPVSKNNGLS
jgi:hypothetical protein